VDFLDKVLSLSPIKRKRYFSKNKVSSSRVNNKQFTRDELTNYLISNNIKKCHKLNKQRTNDEPIYYDYYKEFGGWEKAIQEIFGYMNNTSFVSLRTELEFDEYLINIVVENNINTTSEYKEKAKKFPEQFPPYCNILKRFGKWSYFKSIINAYSVSRVLESYYKLYKALKKLPTREQCESNGIILDRAIKALCNSRNPTKKDFDNIFSKMIEWGNKNVG